MHKDEDDITIEDLILESDTVLLITDGELPGSKVIEVLKSPINRRFKAIAPAERCSQPKWVESVLAELHENYFGTRVKGTDIRVIATAKHGTIIAVSVGNTRPTLVIDLEELGDYMKSLD